MPPSKKVSDMKIDRLIASYRVAVSFFWKNPLGGRQNGKKWQKRHLGALSRELYGGGSFSATPL